MYEKTGIRDPGWRVRATIVVAALAVGCAGLAPIAGCDAADGLTPVCELTNPEDLAGSHGGWLIISQMSPDGGELTAFRPSDETRRTLYRTGEDFLPHGIDLSRDGKTLYVVDHGGDETVEVFDVGSDGDAAPPLTHRLSVEVPEDLDAHLNDVAATPTGFVATKMFPRSQTWGMVKMIFRSDTGHLVAWDAAGDRWKVIENSHGLAPNGLAASADGRRIIFSEWGRSRLISVNTDGTDRKASDSLGFSPDNISWTRNGQLLVAGQYATPLETVGCLSADSGTTCALGSGVARVDPDTLEIEHVLRHDPATVVGAASVALEHDDRIWVGTFLGNRIVWFKNSGSDR